jgi:hypothetical protein
MSRKKPHGQPPSSDGCIENQKPAFTQSFDQWFTKLIGSGKAKPALREPLKQHLKAYGFYDDGRFEEGLKHFGL